MATSTYTPIISTTVSGSSTTSVSLTSIPSTYTDLIMVCYKNDNSPSDSRTNIGFNNDSTTLYSSTGLLTYAGSATSSRNSNRVIIDDYTGGARTLTGIFATTIYHIMNYANTSVYKTIVGRQGSNDTGVVDYGTAIVTGLYRSTNAITSIQITGNGTPTFGSGSTFTLYGIKAA
jgi:hypothetical protein